MSEEVLLLFGRTCLTGMWVRMFAFCWRERERCGGGLERSFLPWVGESHVYTWERRKLALGGVVGQEVK